MRRPNKEWITEWAKEIWSNRYLLLLSAVFLIIAIVLDITTGHYVSRMGSAVAPDIFLDNTTPIDLDLFYVWGIILVISVLFLYPFFLKVKEFHNVISQFSLLVMIRGIFICMTHLKTPVDAIAYKFPYLLSHISFSNDLFFSGHVAVPFLGFLLFKGDKIRYFFLFFSILMGVVVLFMHVHYTIDVLSAFFITYGTFKIGERFFGKINDYMNKRFG
jgi:hypothetical protein